MASKPSHLALLTAPAHLVQCIELADRIVTTQNVKLTIFVASYLEMATADERIVQSARSRSDSDSDPYDVVHLPPADISDEIEIGMPMLNAAMRAVKPHLRSAIASLHPPPTAFIVNVFAAECLDIADELKIPKYVFVCSNSRLLALMLYTTHLDKEVKGKFTDRVDPVVIPGCDPIPNEDLPDAFVWSRNNYLEFLKVSTLISGADGFLVNSWEELQQKEHAALRDGNLIAKAPVFPVGPIASKTKHRSKTELLDWLENQYEGSVLYISFGSTGSLSQEQMTEMAWGLERSRQRFVWVVRKPTVLLGDGSGQNYWNEEDLLSYLPEGFVARTREVGIVIPRWAPQIEILNHPSVGGFFTHCGWNSAIECITNGLAMIAWPLYAEQKMNATILSDDLGIAVRSKVNPSKAVVGREEIEAMVRRVMEEEEGKTMRAKVKQLKASGEKAWSKGGSSWNAMANFVGHCLNKNN